MVINNIVYGINVVESLLKNKPFCFRKVYIAKNFKNKRLSFLIEEFKKLNFKINIVNRKFLDHSSNYSCHQGVLCLISVNNFFKREYLNFLIRKKNSLFLILDCITDPRNFGSCLRSAYAVNVDAVIYPKNRSASLNSTVRKASSGAADLISLVSVGNISQVMLYLKKKNVSIIGTSSKANKYLYDFSFKKPLALVFGSEDVGMRSLTKRYCDYLISIPILGKISSLNVSSAVSIVLYEVFRQTEFNRFLSKENNLIL